MNILDAIRAYFANKDKIDAILTSFKLKDPHVSLRSRGDLTIYITSESYGYFEDQIQLLLGQIIGCNVDIPISASRSDPVPLDELSKVLDKFYRSGYWATTLGQLTDNISEYSEFIGRREDLIEDIYKKHKWTKQIMEKKTEQKIKDNGKKEGESPGYICLVEGKVVADKSMLDKAEMTVKCDNTDRVILMIKSVTSNNKHSPPELMELIIKAVRYG